MLKPYRTPYGTINRYIKHMQTSQIYGADVDLVLRSKTSTRPRIKLETKFPIFKDFHSSSFSSQIDGLCWERIPVFIMVYFYFTEDNILLHDNESDKLVDLDLSSFVVIPYNSWAKKILPGFNVFDFEGQINLFKFIVGDPFDKSKIVQQKSYQNEVSDYIKFLKEIDVNNLQMKNRETVKWLTLSPME